VSVAGLPKDYFYPTKRSRCILRTPPNAFIQPPSGKVGVLGSPYPAQPRSDAPCPSRARSFHFESFRRCLLSS
jgi:hypothetical protein